MKYLFLKVDTKPKNRDICAGLFSAADRCFPRARLQPPREAHSVGSSDTCCSRRSQRASAPNDHRNSEIVLLYSTVAKYHVSEGNTWRLLEKESRFFCVRCISKKLFLSCRKAKTMRPHSERGHYLSKLLCSLAPRMMLQSVTRRRRCTDIASEEAHREPAESVMYFRSGIPFRSLYQLR